MNQQLFMKPKWLEIHVVYVFGFDVEQNYNIHL